MVEKRVSAERRTVVTSLFLVTLCAMFCLFAGSATTVSRADAHPVPLGVGMNSCDATSETFVDDKLGVDDAETAGQCLRSAAAPRDLLEPGAGTWDASADESSLIEETADEPVYEEPAYEELPADEPAQEGPVYEEPASEPAQERPTYEESTYEEPVQEGPTYEEPEVVWYGGAASAYDPVCNGGTSTSSGIPLDWSTPTVASTWIPDGTYIEIVYNGMSVIAQVTDTGPFVGGRELDLAPGVFYAFGFDSANSWGVRTVSYRIL